MLGTTDLEDHFATAIRLRDQDRFEEAVTELTELLNRSPGGEIRGAGFLVRGGIYEDHLNEPAKALSDYERAVELCPNSTIASTSLFHCLLSFGQIERALQEADRFNSCIPKEKRNRPGVLAYLRLRSKYKACTEEQLNRIRDHFWKHDRLDQPP